MPAPCKAVLWAPREVPRHGPLRHPGPSREKGARPTCTRKVGPKTQNIQALACTEVPERLGEWGAQTLGTYWGAPMLSGVNGRPPTDPLLGSGAVEIACRLPSATQLNPRDRDPREGRARQSVLPVGHLSPKPQGCWRFPRPRRRWAGLGGQPWLALPLGRPQGFGRRSEDGPSLLWPSTPGTSSGRAAGSEGRVKASGRSQLIF